MLQTENSDSLSISIDRSVPSALGCSLTFFQLLSHDLCPEQYHPNFPVFVWLIRRSLGFLLNSAIEASVKTLSYIAPSILCSIGINLPPSIDHNISPYLC